MLVGSLGVLPQQASARPIEQPQASIVGPQIGVSLAVSPWNCVMDVDVFRGSSYVQGYSYANCPGGDWKRLTTYLYQDGYLIASSQHSTYGNVLEAYPTDWSCYISYNTHRFSVVSYLTIGGSTRSLSTVEYHKSYC